MSSLANDAEARHARRGFLFITGAKGWFLVCGTLLNLSLPRLLGDPVQFGDFGLVNTLIAVLNAVMVAGVLQAVSKRTSEQPEAARLVRASALRLQSAVGGVTLGLLVVLAEPLCALIFGDPTLAPYLRIAAVVTGVYAVYAALIGVINGMGRFALQAAFDVAFASLKLVLMVGLVLAGYGVEGALGGFAITALIVALVAFRVTGRIVPPAPVGHVSPPLVGFLAQVMGYVFFINVLLQADLFIVKEAAFEPVRTALAAGQTAWLTGLVDVSTLAPGADLAREATSALAGLFKATKNVSLIPYQAVVAIAFVVFPLISRSTFQSDRAATRTYVFQAVRTSTLLVFLLATLIAAGGDTLLDRFFGAAYTIAAPALLPLLAATAAFAIFYVLASILTAAGHPLDALGLAASAAVLELAILHPVISESPPGGVLLLRAALVVLGANVAALAAAGLVLSRRLGVALPLLSFARATVSSAAALAVAGWVPGHGLALIFVRALVAGVTFLAMAWTTREITRADLALVRSTLSRSPQA
ncbi:MAG: oligosaccharide flippase family protein [Deltaproteobacteria bacterium]|nr:oligosaccharide flippase family protein [Deltaproteobacteria bacterium]MCB9787392.1 oligosaccharide flippase family protein [Deltaproteobacteria bacterium]